MLFPASLAVWKLSHAAAEENASMLAILTSSIVLYLMYLISTLPGRNNIRK